MEKVTQEELLEALRNSAEQEPDAHGEKPDADAAKDSDTKGQGEGEKAEKMLPQSEVDRIVKERLAREKSKHEQEVGKFVPYQKFVEAQAKKHGMSPQEYLTAVEEAERLESVADEAEKAGMQPEAYLEYQDAKEKAKAYEAKQQQEQAEAKSREEWERQVSEFKEKHPNVDLYKLGGNADFLEFIEELSPKLSLADKYDRYMKYRAAEKAAKEAEEKSRAERGTSSGRGVSEGEDYGLSDTQKRLAKENGMSYKEYAEIYNMGKPK